MNNVFQTFQVDIEKLIEMKFVICKQLQQSWESFDKLPFWEMEQMVDHLKKWVEKEKEEREKEEGKHKASFDQKKFMQDTQGSAKKYGIPSSTSSGFKVPSGINSAALNNMNNAKF